MTAEKSAIASQVGKADSYCVRYVVCIRHP